MSGLTESRIREYGCALQDSDFIVRFFDKLPRDFHEEFKDRTDSGDCHLWAHGLRHRHKDSLDGVPVIKFNSAEDSISNAALDVHPILWSIWNNRLPQVGSRIMKLCKVSSCINPNHMYEEVG